MIYTAAIDPFGDGGLTGVRVATGQAFPTVPSVSHSEMEKCDTDTFQTLSCFGGKRHAAMLSDIKDGRGRVKIWFRRRTGNTMPHSRARLGVRAPEWPDMGVTEEIHSANLSQNRALTQPRPIPGAPLAPGRSVDVTCAAHGGYGEGQTKNRRDSGVEQMTHSANPGPPRGTNVDVGAAEKGRIPDAASKPGLTQPRPIVATR